MENNNKNVNRVLLPVKLVRMYGWDARVWNLKNADGVTTVDDGGGEWRKVLQARTAFDGMVNCLMQLFGFELEGVRYEDYEEGGEG